ncbi:TPA: glycosyltransferase family 2 protein [Vibrio vulnificus]|nr:glycosyltransferase family 2 protein [Vibrio vulnificus]
MIAAVIVTYIPEVPKLERLLESIRHQVSKIYIVNNGPLLDLSRNGYDIDFDIVQLDENKGIGLAQNIGVQKAYKEGFSHTLLLDQDSTLEPHSVERLLKGFVNELVAAVGPTVLDSRNGKAFKYFTYNRFSRSNSLGFDVYVDDFYETDILISSGTIVNNKVFQENENFDELFIEYVDVEWCLRLRASGYKILFSKSVLMKHELGDSRERLLGVEFPLHQPHRYYFVVRNALYCSCRTNFSYYFRFYNLIRCVALILFVLVKSPGKRLAILKSSFSGIVDSFKLGRKK